jgi:hypothetical protein
LPLPLHVYRYAQGNVFTYLQQQGGVLPEAVAVPMLLMPTMSALDYIHQLVRRSTCGALWWRMATFLPAGDIAHVLPSMTSLGFS